MRVGEILYALLGIMVAQPMVAARGDDIPFTITIPPGMGVSFLKCSGPFRESACLRFEGAEDHRNFYSAEENHSSPFGKWYCGMFTEAACIYQERSIEFCISENNPRQVDLLKYDAYNISVNASFDCDSAWANAILGQDGEDAGRGRDQDMFDFAGKPGEKVALTLARDGSVGSMGESATMRVLSQGGSEIVRRRGPLPLALDVLLPGLVQFVVQRGTHAGDTFRGGHALAVTPTTGKLGERLLMPRENVDQ